MSGERRKIPKKVKFGVPALMLVGALVTDCIRTPGSPEHPTTPPVHTPVHEDGSTFLNQFNTGERTSTDGIAITNTGGNTAEVDAGVHGVVGFAAGEVATARCVSRDAYTIIVDIEDGENGTLQGRVTLGEGAASAAAQLQKSGKLSTCGELPEGASTNTPVNGSALTTYKLSESSSGKTMVTNTSESGVLVTYPEGGANELIGAGAMAIVTCVDVVDSALGVEAAGLEAGAMISVAAGSRVFSELQHSSGVPAC